MPQRKGVTFARVGQNDRQVRGTLARSAVLKVESRQSVEEGSGCIFKVGCSRADFRPGCTRCACRDEGLVSIELEPDPAEGSAHEPTARIVHLQGVSTTQVDRNSRRRVDDELTGWRP